MSSKLTFGTPIDVDEVTKALKQVGAEQVENIPDSNLLAVSARAVEFWINPPKNIQNQPKEVVLMHLPDGMTADVSDCYFKGLFR